MNAWVAWLAATRLLFWSWLNACLSLISSKEDAALKLTAFNPRRPQDMFDMGYVLFIYDLARDSFLGHWRPKDSEYLPSVQLWELPYNSKGVPFHEVNFTDIELTGYGPVRAVEKRYADKHFKLLRYQEAA